MGCTNCNPTNLPVIPGPAGVEGPPGPKGDPGDQGPIGPNGCFGKTLIVSSCGDDATAIPYDIVNHYSTISAAKNAAVDGDLILVHPGVYNEGGNIVNGINTTLYKRNISYHFLDGAVLNILPGTYGFWILEYNPTNSAYFNITGDLHIIGGLAGVVLAQVSKDTRVHFECKSIDLEDNVPDLAGGGFGIYCGGGRINVIIKDYIAAPKVPIYSTSTYSDVEAVIKAKKIIWSGNRSHFLTSCPESTVAGAIYLLNNAHKGTITIEADEISNRYGGGSQMIVVSNIPQMVTIKCKQLINNWDEYDTASLLLTNILNYVRFEGNIYSNASGSKAAGVWTSVTQLTNWNQYIEIVGDMYLNTNYAFYINNGPTVVRYSGNIWGNNDGSQFIDGSWPGPRPNGGTRPVRELIYIGYETPLSNPTTVSQLYLKDCSLNQMATGALAIFKKQALLTTGAIETSQYMQLQNVSMYIEDGDSGYCIDGDSVAVANDVHLIGCVSNAPVSPNITELGQAVVIDATMQTYYDNAYINY